MQENIQHKTVAIIGAGVAGLTAAKESLECGLLPTIFEKTSGLGGLWNPRTGYTWETMHTNISRYSCCYSDFPWPESTDSFPIRGQVYNYLCDYASHFNVDKHIKYDTTVNHVQRGASSWLITSTNNNVRTEVSFDFLIVAVGVAKPYFPTIEGRDKFMGEILHSGDWNGPNQIKGESIVIIGSAFSATEISNDICENSNKKITSVITSPVWILPRHVPNPSDKTKPKIPVDFQLFKRKEKAPSDDAQENEKKKHEFYSTLSNQEKKFPSLAVDTTKSAKITFSEDYIDYIKSGRLILKKGAVSSFDETGIVIEDGTHIDTDTVIFCTGYGLDLSFLDKDILDALDYKPEDLFQPIIAHMCVFHPDLDNFALVGVYRGAYFGIMELQARWTALVFSGKVEKPSNEKMKDGLANEVKIRNLDPKPQFPHGDYVEFADSLAGEIKALPDLKRLKREDPELYDKLMNYLMTPAHYRLQGYKSNREQAIKQIDEVVKVSGY